MVVWCHSWVVIALVAEVSGPGSEFLISFEKQATLAQQWLECAPLRIHLEPINKELMLLVIIQS